jgi:integrase/recombinase XerD
VRGEAVEDPTAPVARPRAGRRIPHHPSREDLERLLGGVEGEPEAGLLKALLRFLYGTGLRLSEAVSLDLESLIFEEEDDPLRDSRTAVHRRKPVALRVIGKGDKERLVPLSPLAQAGLEEWLALRGKHQGALFVYREGRRRGHRVGVSWLQKKLKGLALRVGLDPRKASPHKFRHAYATELVNAGVGLDAIKELLGHASIATTQIYAHTSYRRLQEAAGRLL